MNEPTGRRAIDFRQERRVSDIINVTFVFLRDEFKGLARALLYIVGPLMLLSAILTSQAGLDVMQGMFDPEYWLTVDEFGFGAAYWAGMVAFMLAYVLAYSLFYAYCMLYEERGPGPFSPGEVWARMRADAGKYLSTVAWIVLLMIPLMALNVIICLGTIVFLAILVYIAPILMLVFPARLDRGGGFFAALKRCRQLIRGEWPASFGLLFVMQVLVWLISTAITVTVMGLQGLVIGAIGTGVIARILAIVINVASVVVYAAYVLPAVAFVIHYFNLVEQQEGVGLEARIEAIAADGGGASPDPLAL